MGYRISGLGSLPILPGKSLYAFVFGEYVWDGGLLKQVEDNFAEVAKGLGPEAAIIRGHEGTLLSLQVMEAIEDGPANLHTLLRQAEEGEGSVVILGAHPTQLRKDDLAIFATLSELEKRFGSLPKFFSALCTFSRSYNEEFIEVFEEKSDAIGEAVNILELKPNFCGIGLNLNAAIERWRSAREQPDASR